MKKQLLFLILAMAGFGTQAQIYSGGSGTSANPYLIANKADLKMLSENPAHWGYSFSQTADVKFTSADFATGGAFYNSGLGFRPIGDSAAAFIGTYNGNGYTIDSLYINRPNENQVGFFGRTQNDTICNIGITNASITAHDYVGVLVGYNYDTIRNAYCTGTVMGNNCVGGVVGYNDGGNLSQIYNSGTVNSSGSAVGGLIGYNNGSVSQTYNSGTVNSSGSTVGGLIGYNNGSVSQTYNSGTVNTSGDNVGGLIGWCNSISFISSAYNTGTISGHSFVGGLVGVAYGTISNAYNSGAVNVSYGYAGGLIGKNGATIDKAYNTGVVTSCISGNYSQFTGGLAGYNNGTIRKAFNTSVVNGRSRVGGLVGGNYGTISNAYSTGVVSGTAYVGGVVGSNYIAISNAYSTGAVNGTSNVGGFVGSNNNSISYAYSTGQVSGVTANTGGFCGYQTGASFNNCFWDTQTSGTSSSVGGIGQTTAQMQTQTTFIGATWDFVGETTNGTADVWTMGVCNTDGVTYPILTWQVFSAGGGGTISNPFIIATKADLKTLSETPCLWTYNFSQTADIKFTAADFQIGGAFYNGGAGFSPIGNYSTRFAGSYNGNNYVIDSLYINRPNQNYIGLFGFIQNTVIKKLYLNNASVFGYNYVGGLVGTDLDLTDVSSSLGRYASSTTGTNTVNSSYFGYNDTLNQVYVTGNIHGNDWVGGLVGVFDDDISYAYNKASVSGVLNVGGLVGVSYTNSHISQAYSTGTVTCTNNNNYPYVGGFISTNFGAISDAYSTGTVNGSGVIGGFVGYNFGTFKNVYSIGVVNSGGGLDGAEFTYFNNSNSFWDIQSSGQTTSIMGTGDSTYLMQTQSTFTGAGWDFVGETTNGTADIWKMGGCFGYPVFSWQITSPAILTNTSTTAISCFGGNNGVASVAVSGGTPSYTYSWLPSGGTTSTASGLTAGSYTCTITDASACKVTKVFNLIQPATITKSQSFTICAGQSIVVGSSNYTSTGTYTNILAAVNGCDSTVTTNLIVNVQPNISVNSGAMCAGSSFTMSPSGATSYTYSNGSNVVMPTSNTNYTVTGSDANGCMNTAVSTVMVNALPNISVNSGAICAGSSFTMSPSGATSYTYSTGSNVVMPTSNTNYTVTGSDANGCMNTAVSTVTVNALPAVSVTSGTICLGASYTMVPSGATSYTYSNGSNTVMPTSNTSYTVTGMDANSCVNTAVSTVTVNTLPSLTATSSNSLLCSGQTSTLTATGAVSYTWNTAATNAVIAINPTITTTYTVQGIDANGCINSAMVTQNVSICTGIDGSATSLLEKVGVRLYPNPNNGNFSVQAESELGLIQVYNSLGQLVYSQNSKEALLQIDLSLEATGLYYVQAHGQYLKVTKQ